MRSLRTNQKKKKNKNLKIKYERKIRCNYSPKLI